MKRGFITRHAYYSADTGAPSGGESVTTATEPAKTEKTFTQAELDAIVKERLERAQRKAAEQAEKARADAEAKTLAEQGEFKALAEQRAAELEKAQRALESAKHTEKELERYQTALKKQLDAARADLPTPIATLLDKLDPAEQLEWLAENRAELTKGDGVGSPAHGKRPAVAGTIPSPRITF